MTDPSEQLNMKCGIDSPADDRIQRLNRAAKMLTQGEPVEGDKPQEETPRQDNVHERLHRIAVAAGVIVKNPHALQQDDPEEDPVPMNKLTEEQVSLMQEHMYLVGIVSKRYHGTTFTQEDIYQEGVIGLMLAASRYETERDVTFSSFAVTYIKGTILRSIRDRDRVVRPLRQFLERDKLIDNAIAELNRSGEIPTDQKIAELTGYTLDRVRLLRQQMHEPRVLSIVGSSEKEDAPDHGVREEAIEDPASSRAFEGIENKMGVEQLLGKLSPREATAIRARAGLNPYDREHAQHEIAQIIGTSQVHAGRILTKALDKLLSLVGEV